MKMACAIGRAVHGVLEWDWECAEEPKDEMVQNEAIISEAEDMKISDLLSEVSDSREEVGDPTSNYEGSGENIGDLLSESEDNGMDIHDLLSESEDNEMDIHDLLSEPEDDKRVDSDNDELNDAFNFNEKLSQAFLSNDH